MPDPQTLFRQMLNRLHRSPDDLLAFLKFSARLYRHSPINQIMIFAQRPEAAFAAEESVWQSLGREVNPAQAIHSFKTAGDRIIPTALFDVTDTTGEETAFQEAIWTPTATEFTSFLAAEQKKAISPRHWLAGQVIEEKLNRLKGTMLVIILLERLQLSYPHTEVLKYVPHLPKQEFSDLLIRVSQKARVILNKIRSDMAAQKEEHQHENTTDPNHPESDNGQIYFYGLPVSAGLERGTDRRLGTERPAEQHPEKAERSGQSLDAAAPGEADGAAAQIRLGEFGGKNPVADRDSDAGRRDDNGGSDTEASAALPAGTSRSGNGRSALLTPQHADSAAGPKAKFRANVAAIRLSKQLAAEGRPASPEEKQILAGYSGWGGIPKAFDAQAEDWREEYAELSGLLTKEEYALARGSTLTAFYTRPEIAAAIWQKLAGMGFQEGRVLEPALGTGCFFGAVPEGLKPQLTGIELDFISGTIARQLYPDANIRIQGFEDFSPSAPFDAVVGNVPFGDFSVYDPKYNPQNFLIHDYFFAKSLALTRPGGVVAFITSMGTLDKQDSTVRKQLAKEAELLGAVRLPRNTFGGTNERFNRYRSRSYDGSYLIFPGMTPEIDLLPHQKDAVARVLQGGNALLAHVVGAGKTYKMIAAGMKLRQTGTARKILYVVPNHLVLQMGRGFSEALPFGQHLSGL